jgi:hypothetical protein
MNKGATKKTRVCSINGSGAKVDSTVPNRKRRRRAGSNL